LIFCESVTVYPPIVQKGKSVDHSELDSGMMLTSE
jgi:hypothetical protein